MGMQSFNELIAVEEVEKCFFETVMSLFTLLDGAFRFAYLDKQVATSNRINTK